MSFSRWVCFIFHKDDAPLMKTVLTHLSTYRRNGTVSWWEPTMARAGGSLESEMNQAMAQADRVVVGISANLLGADEYSDDADDRCVAQAVAQAARGTIPVVLRSVKLTGTRFEGMVSLPRSGQSVATASDRDGVGADIAGEIYRAVYPSSR